MRTSIIHPVMVAALGDSLTLGGTGSEKRSWSEIADADPRLYPRVSVANHGKAGDTAAGMDTRFDNSIAGQKYKVLWEQGWINDIVQDRLAADIWATGEATIDKAIAAGMTVFLVTTSPFQGSANYSAPRQTQLLALRALMMAKAGVRIIDLYTLMADPLRPTYLNPIFDFGDGEHYSTAGQAFIADLAAQELYILFPPARGALADLGFVGLARKVQVTPADPGMRLWAQFPGAARPELVHDGVQFAPGYESDDNSRASIINGFQFTIARDNGWPTGASLSADLSALAA